MFIDALHVKIRDGQVGPGPRPVYAAIGVDLSGHGDVLGMWVGDGSLRIQAEGQCWSVLDPFLWPTARAVGDPSRRLMWRGSLGGVAPIRDRAPQLTRDDDSIPWWSARTYPGHQRLVLIKPQAWSLCHHLRGHPTGLWQQSTKTVGTAPTPTPRHRAYILDGLLKAMESIDEVQALIRHSETVDVARFGLMELLTIDGPQAQEILNMTQRQLVGLERKRLVDEMIKVVAEVSEFEETPRPEHSVALAQDDDADLVAHDTPPEGQMPSVMYATPDGCKVIHLLRVKDDGLTAVKIGEVFRWPSSPRGGGRQNNVLQDLRAWGLAYPDGNTWKVTPLGRSVTLLECARPTFKNQQLGWPVPKRPSKNDAQAGRRYVNRNKG